MKRIAPKTIKEQDRVMNNFWGVDWKTTPENLLAEVDDALKNLGYEVVLADIGDDHVWFDIQKRTKRKSKHLT